MNDYFSKWMFQFLLLFGMVLNASAQMQCVTDVMLIGGSNSDAPIETTYLADNGTTPTVMAMPIINANSTLGASGTNTWYTLQGEMNIDSRITIKGTVNLILADNTKLNANKGINVPSGSTLHIWGQSENESKMGVLNADARSQTGCAGIGGNEESGAGKIHIHGGVVTGTGHEGAGIGGGSLDLCNDIVISGGMVIGLSTYGAGIGSGYNGLMYRLDGYSSNPKKPINTITISGGFVSATSIQGAGLGGGSAKISGTGLLGNLHITGGTVLATVFYENTGSQAPQAIGHGLLSPGNNVDGVAGETTLYDNAKVKAGDAFLSANNRYKVMGRYSQGNHFTMVKISPCDHDGATYTTNGDGTHTINCTYCLGGTIPHDYVFGDGGYICNSCHAKKDDEVEVCNVALFTYNDSGWEGLNYRVTKGDEFPLPSRNDITNFDFVGWKEVASMPSSFNPLMDSDEDLLYPGQKVTVDADKKFAARYRPTSITLASNASNEQTLANNFDCTRTVILADRTLRKDGTWNTLCLPFSVKDGANSDNLTFSGTPLQGAIVKKLESATFANGTLTLIFSSDQTTIEAGMPYIVKWVRPDGYVAYDGSNAGTCSDVVNPVFSGVTITSLIPSTVTGEAASIIGLYNPYDISDEDNTILYLGADNKLYHPDDAMTIGSMGAYFLLADGITATEGDISNHTIPDLELSSVSLTIAIGSRNTLEVTSGSGKYSVESSNHAVATAMVDNSIITVTGVGEGQATITVTDKKSGQTATITVEIIYSPCPDDNHPHMVDLGLPSGTKWACCNVGAETPEDYGGYYAWGETKEKSTYYWPTYIHCDGTETTCHDLGSGIAGMQYDVAHVLWGGPWVMPSQDQCQELLDNCTSEWTTVNGVNGRIFTGANGGSIFLPAAGDHWRDNFLNAGSQGGYWSSTQNPSRSHSAYHLSFDSDYVGCGGDARCYGNTVRPVVQTYLACPDNNHPHLIDLGLPSGTKWSCCNVGADKPEAYGGYYAWGETEEKSMYGWSTYIHCDGWRDTCHDLGNDIAGTEYDVAHVKWGSLWVMPSSDQCKELDDYCMSEWTTLNGIRGKVYTGSNRGSIFLPAAGDYWSDNLNGAGVYSVYWSSTQDPSRSYCACGLYFFSNSALWHYDGHERDYGSSVRPVFK